MFIKVNQAPKGETKNNKGSCVSLASYLDKEKETSFFGRGNINVSKETVISTIDKNVSQLGKKDDKFYMLSINPSQDELKHMVGREVNSYSELTDIEKIGLQRGLQSYTHDVMDIYAGNFNRDTIRTGDNLVYFARLETERFYHHYDKEVISGEKKTGDKKDGLNVHVHIIVSRKSKDGNVKLSPNAKSRGNEWDLNGKIVSRGFNHMDFKTQSIKRFNADFKYYPKGRELKNASALKQKYEKYSSGSGNEINKLGSKAKRKVTNTIKQNLYQGQLSNERQLVSKVKRITQTVANPQQAAIRALKNTILKIIGGKEL